MTTFYGSLGGKNKVASLSFHLSSLLSANFDSESQQNWTAALLEVDRRKKNHSLFSTPSSAGSWVDRFRTHWKRPIDKTAA